MRVEFVYDDHFVPQMPKPITYKITENGCWECTSHSSAALGGYTTIWRNGRWMLHRYVYQQVYGPIPDGLVLMHKCDNPRCFNLDHLQPGTTAENNRDKMVKGRASKGEECKFAKLTEEKVRAIRADKRRNYEIADEYGVCKTQISRVRNRQTWKHVD